MYKNSFFETLQVKLQRLRFKAGVTIIKAYYGFKRYSKRKRILAGCPDERSKERVLAEFVEEDMKEERQRNRRVYYAQQAGAGIKEILEAVIMNTSDDGAKEPQQVIEEKFQRGKSKAGMYLGWILIGLPGSEHAHFNKCIEMIQDLELSDFKSPDEAHAFATRFIRSLLQNCDQPCK